jgi:hypothetical protein
MKNIVYSMFSPGLFSQEIIYSLHSVYRYLPPRRSDYRFIIFCPTASEFEGLRADIVQYDPLQLQEWAGSHDFRWRIKLKTLEHALQKYGEPVVVIDGDTYFRKSPDRLFERIRPGRAVLHIREGRVCDLEDQVHRDLTRLLSSTEICDPITNARILATNAMWNAGVIGLHPADLPVVKSVLDLTDRIVAEEPIITAEQFALSYCLTRHTKLRGCDDLVFHYWSMQYRRPFRALLADLLRRTAGLPEAERVKQLYAVRPQASIAKRALNTTLSIFDSVGIRVKTESTRQSG